MHVYVSATTHQETGFVVVVPQRHTRWQQRAMFKSTAREHGHKQQARPSEL